LVDTSKVVLQCTENYTVNRSRYKYWVGRTVFIAIIL